MRNNSSAIAPSSTPLSHQAPSSGLVWGFIGVAAFSFSVPLTRIAVGSGGDAGLDPLLVGCGRAVVAAALAVIALAFTRTRFPTAGQWLRLLPVAAGVVVGFPLFTSLALRHSDSGHAAVIVGLLPAMTAVVAVTLTRERPGVRFWIGAAAGAIATVTFALLAHGGASSSSIDDVYLLCAVVLGAVGYAQGGILARELGAWQTICWALVLALPVMAMVSARSIHLQPPTDITAAQWASFGYLSAVSMFLGFFAWYRGLAIGPMTVVSQTQLVQPVLSVAWGALLLREGVSLGVVAGGIAVIACAAFTVRSRSRDSSVRRSPMSRLTVRRLRIVSG
ncbi:MULTISPECIES: DMT family transporter [Gordonia]|uniref:DMT family transporter n=1 Tax=Gordonia TaxID=2053 RepID=UPI0022E0E13F|nr:MULTISPECIES: DMT family transporter [Gordonia]